MTTATTTITTVTTTMMVTTMMKRTPRKSDNMIKQQKIKPKREMPSGLLFSRTNFGVGSAVKSTQKPTIFHYLKQYRVYRKK